MFEFKIRELYDLGRGFVGVGDFLNSIFEDGDLTKQIDYIIKFSNCLFDIPEDTRNTLLLSMTNHKNRQIRYFATSIIPKFFDKLGINVRESFMKLFQDHSFIQINKIIHSYQNGNEIKQYLPDYSIKISWSSAIYSINNIHKFPDKYQSEIIQILPKIISDIEEFLLDKQDSYNWVSDYDDHWGYFEDMVRSTKRKLEKLINR